MKIAFVPLDDRPCCWRFPEMLADLVGWQMVSAPRELIGRFTTPGQPDALLDWLEATRAGCDTVLASAEMLLFGGLVASRMAGRLPRPRVARMLRAAEGGWLTNVLMRVAPTTTAYGDEARVAAVMEYSRRTAAGRATDDLARKLPEGYLEAYLEARHRNHEVNRRLLEAAAGGHLGFLLLGIDDSKTVGLNVLERQELEPLVSPHSAICPGTDELAHLLMARMSGVAPRIFATWSVPEARLLTPLYEDRSYAHLLQAQVRAAGASLADAAENADIHLFVHLLPEGQKEAAGQTGLGRVPRHVQQFVEQIGTAVQAGQTVAVADLAYANGADDMLMRHLVRHVSLLELDAFSAWNTAGNALGTALAHATLRCLWKTQRPRASRAEGEAREGAHLRFMLNRLLDDWIYQSKVRQKAHLALVPLGVSPYNLGSRWEQVQARVAQEMQKAGTRLFEDAFAGRRVNGFQVRPEFELQAALPWPRLFEVDVACRAGVRWVGQA
ncbi:MAG: DUF4127 family protein [Candidatus Xenobia bacterium]